MTDIVERLRQRSNCYDENDGQAFELLREAADEIERCHRDIKALKVTCSALMAACGERADEIERLRARAE